MRILILGAGGVGGYFGGGRAAGAPTSPFWCARAAPRSSHETGSSCGARSGICGGGAVKAVERVEQSFDLVILSCKSYDLDGAITAIAPAVGPSSLLNGLRHLDALDARFTPRRVLGGCCHIGVALAADGAIEHLNRLARFIYGPRAKEPRRDGHRILVSAL